MKNLRIRLGILLIPAVIIGLTFSSCDEEPGIAPDVSTDLQGFDQPSTTEYDFEALQYNVGDLPYEELSEEEVSSLVWMREEEKLARDVYITLFEQYEEALIFNTISNSEQNHMDAILTLLDKYEIEDPIVDENAIGVFTDSELQELYNSLVAQGSDNLIEGLRVGAMIEEIDITDLMEAEEVVDNEDIAFVYSNLLRGSRNHLRMFVGTLLSNDVGYSPLYLEQELYDSIISSPMESGGKGKNHAYGNNGIGNNGSGNNGNNGNGNGGNGNGGNGGNGNGGNGGNGGN